ncbi:MAG: outer membrane protein [Bacteroidia bacterium]
MRQFLLNTILATIAIFLSAGITAQDSTMIRKHPPKKNFLDKAFIGGNVGLQVGAVTYAEVSPLVGYKFTDKISAGVGVVYQYYHIRDKYNDFETNIYGGRLFGRYMFTDFLFGHAEYEYLNLEAFDFQRRRVDVNSLLAGAGYIQRITPNSGIIAMVLYNFTPSVYTPYVSPVIFRIGFQAGL